MKAPLALIAAMDEELSALLPLLDNVHATCQANRTFHQGTLHGTPVVAVQSGIGKVAAATTTALVAAAFAPRALLFTGVAGGLGDGVAVGDAVVATELIQHDMDASPLFPRHEVPLTGRSRFPADAGIAARVADASAAAFAALADDPGDDDDGSSPTAFLARARRSLGLAGVPRVHRGLIASGDRFVCTAAECARLRRELPDALAVEMEGAAAAQVCADFGLPFAVLRVVSDRADDAAHVDFLHFTREVASVVTRTVVVAAVAALAEEGAVLRS